ncbi:MULTISPECIES: DUF305 domain-containing protein [Subtercola]|uniref:DUF305 domain-containing protein n=1 Tax=Subtercola vilae TaxID=2056433 RepID=A0A4T2C6W4_9MICO|nr:MULTISPECIES: DUF305 domain-containing protein [Subtercola]MEA9985883.1 DUF305 domain-containing protein [Subtercola sp. RTI3]TIH40165.1 DUF305 domain-containing protein [Subtercola vilae]
MNISRTSIISAAAIAAALTLSACAGSTGSMSGMDMGGSSMNSAAPTMGAAANFNAADVTFAQDMVPHHEQAVSMSDTLLAKGNVPETVLQLANTIKSEQSPEIVKLNGWLAAWGATDISTPTSTEMSGMSTPGSTDMSGMSMGTGMMSQADMDQLAAATGNDAAKLYLQQMIVHHTGAVDMAKTELTAGQNADAKALAQSIVSSQTAEISTMQTMLATL